MSKIVFFSCQVEIREEPWDKEDRNRDFVMDTLKSLSDKALSSDNGNVTFRNVEFSVRDIQDDAVG